MKNFLLSLAVIISTVCFYTGSAFALPSTGVRTNYAVNSVSSTAWTQIVASLPYFATKISVGDSANQAMLLGVGAPGSEVVQMIIPPSSSAGAPIVYPLGIPAGSAISLKATTSTVSSGEDDMNFFH